MKSCGVHDTLPLKQKGVTANTKTLKIHVNIKKKKLEKLKVQAVVNSIICNEN